MGRLMLTVRPEPQTERLRDIRGHVIRPGMLIAYARRGGSDQWINVLAVHAIDEATDDEGCGYVVGCIVCSSRQGGALPYVPTAIPLRISVRHAVVIQEDGDDGRRH